MTFTTRFSINNRKTSLPSRNLSGIVTEGINDGSIQRNSLGPTQYVDPEAMKQGLGDTSAPNLVAPNDFAAKILGNLTAGSKLKLGEKEYEIVGVKGSGGFGAVFEVKFEEKSYALKILFPTGSNDSLTREFFLNEAIALYKMQMTGSQNVPKIYNQGKFSINETNLDYIVMEIVEGKSFKKILEDSSGGIKWDDLKLMIPGALAALRDMHSTGIVHNDIKPHNFLFDTKNERTVAIDLGGIGNIGEPYPDLATLSIAWTAPERLKPGSYVSISDVFSLGVTLYELLTNFNPFKDESDMIKYQKILTINPRKLDLPDLPSEVSDVIMKMMEKDPSKRISLNEVIETFEKLGLVIPKANTEVSSRIALDTKVQELQSQLQQRTEYYEAALQSQLELSAVYNQRKPTFVGNLARGIGALALIGVISASYYGLTHRATVGEIVDTAKKEGVGAAVTDVKTQIAHALIGETKEKQSFMPIQIKVKLPRKVSGATIEYVSEGKPKKAGNSNPVTLDIPINSSVEKPYKFSITYSNPKKLGSFVMRDFEIWKGNDKKGNSLYFIKETNKSKSLSIPAFKKLKKKSIPLERIEATIKL